MDLRGEAKRFFEKIQPAWLEVNKRYWEAGESLERSTQIPFFTRFVTPLETRGIPSLFVIVAFILVAIGGTAFFVFGGAQSSSFTIRVLSPEGQPLDNVQVTLTSIDGNYTQTVTSIDGNAVFNLPTGKRYNVQLSGEAVGELEPSVNIVIGQAGKTQTIRLEAKAAAVFLLVESAVGTPVAGALVEYSTSETAKNSRSNASGYAPLYVGENATVTGNASAAGYETASFSFNASSGVHKVTLLAELSGAGANLDLLAIKRQRVQSPNDAEASTRTGSITVTVRAFTTSGIAPVSNAFVVVYNGFAKTVLGEDRTDNRGVVEFRNVRNSNDVNVYAVVEAEGFVTTVTEQTRFNGALELNVTLSRSTANNSFDLLVRTSDERGAVNGDVYVVSTQGTVLSKKASSGGQAVFRQLPKQSFYVAVTSPSHARFVSGLLKPNTTEYTAVLKRANATNTGNITINTRDFQGKVVPGAAVSLFISSVFSPPETRANSVGIAQFTNVPLGLSITIKGEKNSFLGQLVFSMSNNSNETLVLKPPTGTVTLSVVDYSTNQPVSNPQVKLFYRPTPDELVEIPANCTIAPENPSCALSLISSIRYVATASADGFHSSSVEFQAAPFESGAVRIRLFPTSFNQQVAFLGFFDSRDGHKLEADESLSVGKIYSAKFMVKTNRDLTTASNYGLYVRAGNEGESLSSSNLPIGIAFIPPDFSPSSSLFYTQFVNASKTFFTSCDSFLERDGFGLYKWAYAGGGVNSASADYTEIVVPLAAITEGSTSLEYFALTTFPLDNATSEQKVVRYPFDSALEDVLSTRDKKWCNARTESISVNVEKKDAVKCNALACISAYFKQGESASSLDFAAQPTQVNQHNLDIVYNVLDFQSTPTQLTFSPPREALQLDVGRTVPSGVNAGENTFELNVNSFETSGVISAIVQPKKTTNLLRLVFGSKIALDMHLDVAAPPEPVIELSNLGNRYTITYDAQSNSFKLLDETGRSAEFVQMYTDPILPADAVFIYLNYSSSQCEGSESNFLIQLEQDSSCFELVDAPSTFVDNPPVGLKLLKYDASATSCSSHSVDLNKVNDASATIPVSNTCVLGSTSSFEIKASMHPVVKAMDPAVYAGLQSQVVFTEPIDDLGGDNPFDETPRSLWALLINRQHSGGSVVPIGGIGNKYLFDEHGAAVISQTPGSTSAKASLTSGKNFKQELGAVAPPYLLQLFTDGIKDKQIKGGNIQSVKDEVKKIAANTAFRRTPLGCDVSPSCKLRQFPYSLFQPSKLFSFQLGTAYLGANRKHEVNFESVEAPVSSNGKGQQGVYSLSIDYVREGESYRWIPRASPLTIEQGDYFDEECGAKQTLVGPALSWRGTSCLQSCGDGTYFDLQEGDVGRLCDGNTFRVSRFWQETTVMKTIQLAEKFSACLVAGCGSAYVCTKINYASCQSARSALPYSAPAVVAACSPKALGCAEFPGVPAAIGAAEGVEALLTEESGCDQVTELSIGAATGIVGAIVLEGWPPAQAGSTVCRNALAFETVGIDAEAAWQLIRATCIAEVGPRFMSLILSWINTGFVDNDALVDRAYIDIGDKSCTDWKSNVGDYFVYQDCEFKSLWGRKGHTETCKAAENVKVYTKDIDLSTQRGFPGTTETSGSITLKVKS